MKRVHLSPDHSTVVNVSMLDEDSPVGSPHTIDVPDDTFVGPGFSYSSQAGFTPPSKDAPTE